MSIFTRIFRNRPDPREEMRPLWHRVVEVSRNRRWYADDGVADSVGGRFDMIVAVLSLVLLRMEKDAEIAGNSALLTELFVEDMDGQLRQSGVGDMVVGKHIGKLVSVLGGRLGALREALQQEDDTALREVLERNVSFTEGSQPDALARDLRAFAARLDRIAPEDLTGGRIDA
ncbi:Ubiquinol-cytochrome C chaperone [Croceibacterium atlanticum]|uniref:Ubiquinol-cytochrome C chaperone n=1 Tax=Croceibacterium atlanticum TaxID=1267766 RepID=A0A0F7KW87_9SPHN|nr:ubiquinol-cytochrome C chaperone family protein [Croceibacterium atlanticum]AKH43979.1 Ubiquinol-cytochrome C chaperone [Croceibacterium atlanticum]